MEPGATNAIDPSEGGRSKRVSGFSSGGVELVGPVPALKFACKCTRRGGLPNPSVELKIPAVALTVDDRSLEGRLHWSCVPVATSRDLPG